MRRLSWGWWIVWVGLGGLLAESAQAGISRCSWDPACLCIDWSWDDGTAIEVRCPDGEGDSGWVIPTGEPGPGNPPNILDPEGSFDGTGEFGGSGILQGREISSEQQEALNAAKGKAIRRLRSDPKCSDLFANSPLSEDGAWLISKIRWRDGSQLSPTRCTDPEVGAFTYSSHHELQVFLCPIFTELSPDRAAIAVIHETLHVAGQQENEDGVAGPGNPPGSVVISENVAEACNLSWW